MLIYSQNDYYPTINLFIANKKQTNYCATKNYLQLPESRVLL